MSEQRPVSIEWPESMRRLKTEFGVAIEWSLPTDVSGQWCLGIDEAGRGCVCGPMVYGAVAWRQDEDEALGALGFQDSKTLPAGKRSTLLQSIVEHPRIGCMSVSISAESISRSMDTGTNLNDLSHLMILAIVESFQAQLDCVQVCVDAVGPCPKLAKKIEKVSKRAAVCVCEKADSIFKTVSAASIVAKVRRDAAMDQLNALCPGRQMPVCGSGYSSDPVTVAWLTRVAQEGKLAEWREWVRTSWATWARLAQ